MSVQIETVDSPLESETHCLAGLMGDQLNIQGADQEDGTNMRVADTFFHYKE